MIDFSEKNNRLSSFKKYIDEDFNIKLTNDEIYNFLSKKILSLEDGSEVDGKFIHDFPYKIYREFTEKFRAINETREFNSALFAITLLDSSILDKIIEDGFYSNFCKGSFYSRKHSNSINHVVVWDCVFNYSFSKFINLHRANFDNRIFEILALDKEDAYFSAFCAAVDKFCVEKKVKIPIDILDSFYRKDSKHFDKIKNESYLK